MGGHEFYNEAGWASHKEHSSKQHSSMTYTSVSLSRYLWVPALSFLDDRLWCGTVVWNKTFPCQDVLVMLFYHTVETSAKIPGIWGNKNRYSFQPIFIIVCRFLTNDYGISASFVFFPFLLLSLSISKLSIRYEGCLNSLTGYHNYTSLL